MSKRIALIVRNNIYQNKPLSQLKPPEANAPALLSALRDPEVGNFNPAQLITNQSSHEFRHQLRNFFNWKKKTDLLLLYFSGHAVLDESGQLYLAAVDTTCGSLAETGVSAAYILACMDYSFVQQHILIFDCYYSKVSAPEVTNLPDANVGAIAALKGKGYSQVVLAAGDTINYLITGSTVVGEASASVFTQWLIQGLRTGAADTDKDGQIGADELYEYIYHRIEAHPAHQRPVKWSSGEQNKFVIACAPTRIEHKHTIKWDLIFGAIMTPLVTIIIGGRADLGTSIGMAGLLLLFYALLYWVLD